MGRHHDARTARRWFGAVEGELRLGGQYRIKGNASGSITRCPEEARAQAQQTIAFFTGT